MLVATVLDQVRRDVATFADPGTEVTISDDGRLEWVRSRSRAQAQLIRQAGLFPAVSFAGREYSYTGFLASEAMADLKDLAQSMVSVTSAPPYFVPGLARIVSQDPQEQGQAERFPTEDLILKRTTVLQGLPLAASRVLFVYGNAGTGKTSALLRATREQAERYLEGRTTTLLLYLDAQGKGLTQLEDVMARALQDLRARFTYHSVAALTRRHCVVPIVDGFDELIGPSSAREAFANLAEFLAQLECNGALIASSRSGFIDYRILYERAAELAASRNLSYEIVPVEVLPWEDNSVSRYCDLRDASGDLKRKVFSLVKSEAGGLVRKPFFLAQICRIIEEGGAIDEHSDIARQVVDAALSREASKLRDERGRELLTTGQHRRFCEALSDEMWSLGRPELDCDTIRLLAELVADQEGLGPRDTKTFVDRSISHGLLSVVPSRDRERRVFEHEFFRFEFQASRLATVLAGPIEPLRDYMYRSEIPLEVVSRIRFFRFSAGSEVASAVATLNRIVAGAPSNQFAATNAGSIFAYLVAGRADLPAGLTITGFYLRSHDLGALRLQSGIMRESVLERVILKRAALVNCEFPGTQLIRCVFSGRASLAGTKLELGQVSGIAVERGDSRDIEIYGPGEIAKALRDLGATVQTRDGQEFSITHSTIVEERLGLVERLLTHARSHFYISQNEKWFLHNLRDNQNWPVVEALLRESRLIETVILNKSGRPEEFLRLTTAPDKILQGRTAASGGVSEHIARFWDELAADG